MLGGDVDHQNQHHEGRQVRTPVRQRELEHVQKVVQHVLDLATGLVLVRRRLPLLE